GATKHGVVGLCKGLRVEAARHGVRVSVLCQGAIKTPILTGGKFGRINIAGLDEEKMLSLWAPTRPMDPDVFAERALAAVFANEPIIVFPVYWR
ncbi:SDR family NAD(P)-dependent oxidoreductase, partial [Vibrio parahaemolyticus]